MLLFHCCVVQTWVNVTLPCLSCVPQLYNTNVNRVTPPLSFRQNNYTTPYTLPNVIVLCNYVPQLRYAITSIQSKLTLYKQVSIILKVHTILFPQCIHSLTPLVFVLVHTTLLLVTPQLDEHLLSAHVKVDGSVWQPVDVSRNHRLRPAMTVRICIPSVAKCIPFIVLQRQRYLVRKHRVHGMTIASNARDLTMIRETFAVQVAT